MSTYAYSTVDLAGSLTNGLGGSFFSLGPSNNIVILVSYSYKTLIGVHEMHWPTL